MDFQKIKFTHWLTSCLIGILLSGCAGPEISLGFPLANGNTWTYQGTIKYKSGNQVQLMPPLVFKLNCSRLAEKPNFPLILTMREENEPLWSVQFVQTSHGIINPLTGELWIPHEIKAGKKWTVTVEGEKVQLVLRSQVSTTVPAGTFPAYLIDFKRSKREKGSFWLDPDVGIISLTWISKVSMGESLTNLQLASYTLP